MNSSNEMLSPQQSDALLAINQLQHLSYVQLVLSSDTNPELLENRVRLLANKYEILSTRMSLQTQEGGNRYGLEIIDSASVYLRELVDEDLGESRCRAGGVAALIEDDLSNNYLDYSLYIHRLEGVLYLTMPSWSGDLTSLKILAQALSDDELESADIETDDEVIQYIDLLPIFREDLDSDEARAQRLNWSHVFSERAAIFSVPENDSSYRSIELPLLDIDVDKEENHYTYLLTAWSFLLGQYYRSEELLLTHYFDGRSMQELAEVVGPLGKLLPLQVNLKNTKSVSLQAQEIQQHLALSRDSAEYFDWQFVGEHNQADCHGGFEVIQAQAGLLEPGREMKELASCFTNASQQIGNQPISLQVFEGVSGKKRLKLNYDTGHFSVSEVDVLSEQLVHVYQQLLDNSGQRLLELRLLPALHRDVLLGWSRGEQTVRRFDTFTKAFEFFAEHHADEIALDLGKNFAIGNSKQENKERFNYFDLNAKANQLAHFLLEEGLRRGDLIGLCLERGQEQVVSLLACLKLGCCVVPMDPSHPQAHLNRIIDSTACQAILTSTEHLYKVSESSLELALIDWHADWLDIADCQTSNLEFSPSSKSAAYMVHTSGSTGVPKGVVVSQAALQNYVEAIDLKLDLPTNASMTALSSVAADLSYTAVFGALGSGRCLRIIPESHSIDPEELALELQGNPVDLLKIVPSHLMALLTSVNAADILPKHCLVLGGESVDSMLLKQIHTLAPHLRVVNHYGPTEATVGISCGEVDTHSSINIGTPMANTQCYVLDDQGELAGIGIEGDLYLAGDGLSDGYHASPVATSKAFTPDPFSKKSGQRMYRSGDRAYYNVTGQLVFAGRKDQQVKIRGHRIELDEIAICIKQRFADQVLTVAVKHVNEVPRLIVYLVEPVSSLVDIRNHVKDQLPAAMQPHFWIEIPSLPLTINGKLDKKNLPLPPLTSTQSDGSRANNVALSPSQVALLGILKQLLGREDIALSDNFFTLGGDSIVAIQFVARAKQQGLKITARQVLDFPTIAGLAEVATDIDLTAGVDDNEPELDVAFNLSAIQARFFSKITTQSNQYNQSTIFDLADNVAANDIRTCVATLLQTHDMLRLRLQANDDRAAGWQQTIMPCSEELLESCFEQRSLSDESEQQELSYLQRLEAAIKLEQSRFDLLEGPLIKFVLFDRYSEQDETVPARLFVVAHHLIVDAVSWSILELDLRTLYQQINQEQPLQLPHKSQSYQQWVKKAEDLLSMNHWRSDVDYWTNAAQNQVELPIDRALVEKHNRVGKASNKLLVMPQSLLDSIEQQANLAFNTRTEELLLTALCYAFEPWTGAPTLSIMMEANGRDISSLEHDSSRTIGWFTSMYPANISINAEQPKVENLMAVKEQLRSVPESGFSYGALKYLERAVDSSDDSIVSRDLDTTFEPQISFNFFGRLFSQQENDLAIGKSELFNVAQTESRALTQERAFLIEVMVMHTEQGLAINLIYPPELISDQRIESILGSFEQSLTELVAECVASEGGMTPSDFADVTLSQGQINRLFESCSLDRHQVETIYPATQVQAGILFHSLTMPGTGVYVPQHALEINMPLQVDAFKSAWRHIISRHAPFRTLFANLDSAVPLQVVAREAELDFLELDWSDKLWPQDTAVSGQDSAERSGLNHAFSQLLKEQWVAPFDFQCAPLMRMCLVKLSNDCYRFIWTYHHTVIDGWSGPIILRELFSIYEALCNDQEIKLPSNPSFVEYIRWLDKQDEQAALDYWKSAIEDFHYGKQLSEVLPSPKPSSHEFGKYEVVQQLSAADTQGLGEFARQQGVTLSVVCQAAWALMLYRYTQEKDLMFGVTVSGRPAELDGVESMVGQLINTLPFRVGIDLAQPLNTFLKDLHKLYVQSSDRAFIPLSKIQGYLNSRLSHGPFDTLFVFENYPIGVQDSTDDGDALCRHLYSVSQNNYPLSLVVVPGEHLELTLKYSPKFFSATQLSGVLEVYRQILNQFSSWASDDPSILPSLPNLGDIPLFDDDELSQVRKCYHSESIQTDTETGDMASRFYSLAMQCPKQAALIEDEGEEPVLSYQELDELSNQFCHFLIDEGLAINSRIGVLLSRSKEYVISVLGCLKAGCAFVPLDPDSPPARLGNIIEKIGLHAIVTTEQHFEKVSDYSVDLMIDWQQDRELILSSSKYRADITIHPEQCAYTICTSGTSGIPKGVNISHRSLLNYIDAIDRRLDLSPQASMGALATPAADLSYTALFGALGTGRSFRLISENKKLDSDALAAELATKPVSCLKIVPSHLSALLTVSEPQRILPTECLVLGGEAATDEILRKVSELAPQLRVVNHYGPTETTIGIATHEYDLQSQDTDKFAASCIGRPLANSQCYVLNEQLDSVGFDVEADLFLSGPQLALGYHDQAALTAQTFLPDPFSAERGARMYRSGDRARFLHGGDLIFSGRHDQQKKIRGFRIELSEIESCILGYAAIQQAAVTYVGVNQREQLVAYVVGKAENEPLLKEHLLTELPDYMQPKLYVWLAELPLTSNGKLDRRSLPKPTLEARTILSPSSDLQLQIAGIWSEFLGVDNISMDDNFFDLGGDSLMLMRLHRRMSDEILNTVQITDLFKYSTIAQFADFIASQVKRNQLGSADSLTSVQLPGDNTDQKGALLTERNSRRKQTLEGRQTRANRARGRRNTKTKPSDHD
jgi:amino acid adenylation domain-containing protein/non-ribosomal peptide synthase protein (TIGR01720 family)